MATALAAAAHASLLSFDGQYFTGNATDAAGASFLSLLDQARRMLSTADVELQAVAGVYDPLNSALVEGAQWSGNIWTQNTYGFGLAAPAFLPDPLLTWLRTSYLWWFDHAGDGAQGYGGLNDVPAGMLCDNGSPTGCNYMQCGPGRQARLIARAPTESTSAPASTASKRSASLHEQKTVGEGDTAALGHDFIIEGTLAGVLMQAELLLATRNITGAVELLPLFRQTSDFLETRRVQDSSPLTPGAAGLFFAGNGANLLAPGYGGQGLPAGCLGNASCGQPGFPACCSQRGMAYLSALSVSYSAVLDRLIKLEELAYPQGRRCTTPNSDTTPVTNCTDVYRARRAANAASLPAVMARMQATNTSYLLQALAPDGERYGEYAPASPCAVDAPCPPVARHGYFEASPNVDAIALRVVDDETADGIYAAMRAVPGLSPCDFTLPNFPDYDGSCSNGGCLGGFGTWVSGGSWSTLEGRAVLAHYRQRRLDLAAASMSRLISPYAKLFKLENPIAHQGCASTRIEPEATSRLMCARTHARTRSRGSPSRTQPPRPPRAMCRVCRLCMQVAPACTPPPASVRGAGGQASTSMSSPSPPPSSRGSSATSTGRGPSRCTLASPPVSPRFVKRSPCAGGLRGSSSASLQTKPRRTPPRRRRHSSRRF